MPDIPMRLVEIVQQLKDGTQPRRASARSVLKWFGAARRRAGVVAQIEEALRLTGLATEPHFAQADVDEPLRFFLRLSANEPARANQGIGAAQEAAAVVAVAVAAGQDAIPLADGAGSSLEPTSPDFLEPEADEAQPPSNADDRPVSSQPHDWTLSTLRDKSDRGQLDLQPQYQREYIWRLRPELPSRLIESLLLEIPIPPIYFGKVAGGRLEVIDGQQRLTTMINFVSNKFRLQRLERMGSLNGKLFRDLTEEHQNKVLDAPIRSIVIDAGHNAELRYEIFQRLNRGSMALNEQELRNCVFRGPFNDLLAQLELDPHWRKIRGAPNPEPRFIEREIILRFFAFINRLQFYTGNLKRFLNKYMEAYAPRNNEEIEVQANIFRQAVLNIYNVFGLHSARLYNADPRTHKGAWDTKFSVAALDIQAGALAGKPPGKVQAVAEQIREQYLYSLLSDPLLQSAISRQTGSTTHTKYRWTTFKSIVEPYIEGTVIEPRFFDITFRRHLFDESPICKLCGNQIHTFEDTTVDHILPYSKAGMTVPENGQLAHRSCNARKNMYLNDDPAFATSSG